MEEGKRLIIIAKGHNDKVYAYLQSMSKWTPGTSFRYVYKTEINQKKMAEELGMTQSAISKAIKRMIINPEDEKSYQLIEDNKSHYSLPEAKKGVLYYLVDNKLNYEMATLNGLTKDCLKVYGVVAYLYDRDGAKAHVYKSYILDKLGMANTGQNLKKVWGILNTLVNIGLIELDSVVEPGKYGKDNVRYDIKAVNSEVKQSIK